MHDSSDRTRGWKAAAILLAATAALLVGGCPVDFGTVLTDMLAAALDSTSTSLVETLSTYLAQQ